MLGFKATALGHRPRKPGLATTARAATVVTGVVYAVVVARTAVPYSAAIIAASIPVVRAWMAPPFLFVAIHIIILVIWKLSENINQDDTPPLNHDKPLAKIAPPEILQTAASEDFAETEAIIPNNHPDFGRSMSEQNSGDDIKLTSLEIEKSDFTTMSVEEPPVVLVAAEEDDSMESRWKAIMQGGTAPVVRFTLSETVAGGILEREVPETVAGGVLEREVPEDLNKRFDAFIKKHYEQIRVTTALETTSCDQ